MTSQYERELRHVLAGIPTGVEAVIKSCSVEEKERMRLVLQRPFLVVRAAGSGIEGSGDLLALRGDVSFPIEVKTTKSKKIYFSGRTLDQYNALAYEGERCGLMPLYAHRLKGTMETGMTRHTQTTRMLMASLFHQHMMMISRHTHTTKKVIW